MAKLHVIELTKGQDVIGGIHEYLKKRRELKDYIFARPEDGGMGKTYVTLSL